MRDNTVAIYARISKKGWREGNGSESILNQIRLAREWIREEYGEEESRILIFCDEGYTGTNMDRPAVLKLLAGIFLKRIAVVVMKDFSRLSRNHLQLSELLEMTFPRYPVRIVSISEGYDSAKGSEPGPDIGIKSIFYEYYCRDVSRKVKESLDARKGSGYHAVPAAPYGYRKRCLQESDPGMETHGKETGEWEIYEPEAAEVQKIYQMAAEGKNCAQIARLLQGEDGEEPAADGRAGTKKKFVAADIWRILNNPVYTGRQVWHKYESVYQNGFVVRTVPRECWRTREGMHPAIITEELSQRVQENCRRTAGYGKRKGRRHLFHGITKCAFCNAALCRSRSCRDELICRCPAGRAFGGIRIGTLWRICSLAAGEEMNEPLTDAQKELFLRIFINKLFVGEDQKIYLLMKTQKNTFI